MADSIDKFISEDRKDFEKGTLDEHEIPKSPFILFELWLKEAIESEESEAYVMTLSTIKEDQPKSRVVYLRGFENGKFIFYTNYESDKGEEIEQNSNVSLNFYWSSLERQVRINGKAKKCDKLLSDNYFSKRPRASQIGAWASRQSTILKDREDLDSRIALFENKFKGKEIPRPDHWGGFEVNANEIEFWQGRKSRLHDRIAYKSYGDSWTIQRKSP